MSIEVKQLTINSTLQRCGNGQAEASNDEKPETDEEQTEAKAKTPKNAKADDACLDPDQIKADVLAACKKLIQQSMNERRAR